VVVEEVRKRGIKLADVKNFRTIPGKGVVAEVDEGIYVMGNEKPLEEFGIHIHEKYLSMVRQVGTTMAIVANESGVPGVLGFEDELRSEAGDVIKELKKRGFKLVMLTGDLREIAKKIARRLGIDQYFAELLPNDKVEVMEELMGGRERHAAMVSDCINDAPALARACVGIATESGAKVAIESGD